MSLVKRRRRVCTCRLVRSCVPDPADPRTLLVAWDFQPDPGCKAHRR